MKRTAIKQSRPSRKTAGSRPDALVRGSDAAKEYMGRVAALGCALCRMLGLGETPAEVHHRRTGTGAGRRAPDDETAPLCPAHHEGQSGLHGMGRKAFESAYGVTEMELINRTREMLGLTPIAVCADRKRTDDGE